VLPGERFVPNTVSVNGGPPAVMLEGEIEVMVPAVNCDLCPPVGPRFAHAGIIQKEAINPNPRSRLHIWFFIGAAFLQRKPKTRGRVFCESWRCLQQINLKSMDAGQR
jgi:hypothetical protein